MDGPAGDAFGPDKERKGKLQSRPENATIPYPCWRLLFLAKTKFQMEPDPLRVLDLVHGRLLTIAGDGSFLGLDSVRAMFQRATREKQA